MGHQTPTLQAHQRPTYRKQFNFWRKTHKWYNLHLWLKGRVFTFIGHQCGFVKFTARTQPPTALWQTAPPWGNFTEIRCPWAQPHFFLALPPPPGPASSSPHSQEQVGPYPIPGISSDSCIIWIPVSPLTPFIPLCLEVAKGTSQAGAGTPGLGIWGSACLCLGVGRWGLHPLGAI